MPADGAPAPAPAGVAPGAIIDAANIAACTIYVASRGSDGGSGFGCGASGVLREDFTAEVDEAVPPRVRSRSRSPPGLRASLAVSLPRDDRGIVLVRADGTVSVDDATIGMPDRSRGDAALRGDTLRDARLLVLRDRSRCRFGVPRPRIARFMLALADADDPAVPPSERSSAAWSALVASSCTFAM